jgi:hypothetical protein
MENGWYPALWNPDASADDWQPFPGRQSATLVRVP